MISPPRYYFLSKALGNLVAMAAEAGIMVEAIDPAVADGADIVGSLVNDVAVSIL